MKLTLTNKFLNAMVISAAFMVSGCGDSGDPAPTGPGNGGDPTFSGNVRPILQSRCVACHSTQPMNGGLNLSEYASLMAGGDSGPAVVPNQPDSSLLVKRISGSSVGEQMPQGGPYLSAEQINAIRRWIELGARND